jgi:polysaccharide deacetylase family protein (PEP-CTERM system associated)
MRLSNKCVFTVDVEDWFHILDVPGTPPIHQWAELPSGVEANFHRLTEILAERGVRATCFFLGWVAERFPHLVTHAHSLGHEIASHGYAHQLVYTLTRAEFQQDIARTKHLLEDITGEEVPGYRAPGFSVTRESPWFFNAVRECGYTYDSSVFPAARGHGGLLVRHRAPYIVDDLVEVPITVIDVVGRPVCLFGGGYLRLSPLPLTIRMAHRVLAENRPVIFYLHPREIDPTQLRLPMDVRRRFRSYVNLATTERKVRAVLNAFEFTLMRDIAEEHRAFSARRSMAAAD